jgi:hydroxymethylpyrimidine pyrophosphatase-like HAD family hydrolase
VKVVLVTGRRHPSARRVAEELGGPVDLVLHNGALVVEEGRVLLCRPLALATARRAIRAGRARGVPPVVHCGLAGEGRLLVETEARAGTLVSYYLEQSRPDVTIVADLLLALVEDPLQVMFGGRREEMEELLPSLRAEMGDEARIERTVYPRIDIGILDVLDPGVGKQQALVFLQERWGVSAEETLAIGDNWNDREMLERAGLGLVMGNAAPELLSLGFPVLPSNDEDGVALGIESHVLGRGPDTKSKRG